MILFKCTSRKNEIYSDKKQISNFLYQEKVKEEGVELDWRMVRKGHNGIFYHDGHIPYLDCGSNDEGLLFYSCKTGGQIL